MKTASASSQWQRRLNAPTRGNRPDGAGSARALGGYRLPPPPAALEHYSELRGPRTEQSQHPRGIPTVTLPPGKLGNCPEAKRHEAARVHTPEPPQIGAAGGGGRPAAGRPEDPGPRPPWESGARRGALGLRRGAPSRRAPRPRASRPAAAPDSGAPLRAPAPRPAIQPRARPALTRSMWEKPVSTRFLRSSQPMPPAPTTSTRPPATASASSRGSPRDSAMAGRPRAAAEAEAGEASRGRKRVGEGRPGFRSCALRPRPASGGPRPRRGPGGSPAGCGREAARTSGRAPARSGFSAARADPLSRLRSVRVAF